MMNELFDFCKQAGVPIDTVCEHYENFIKKGIIYTPAKSAEELFSIKYPLRFAMAPPTASEGKSAFSLGPFALAREDYEQIWSKLPELFSQSIPKKLNSPSLCIMYAFKRIQYEKLGATFSESDFEEGYGIEAQEEAFERLCAMMRFWDVTKPDVRELFVWILPNQKCKQFAEKITGKKFKKNDFTWWNVLIDFEETLQSPTPQDVPERFSFSPSNLIGPWSCYLPATVTWVIISLYAEATKGLSFKSFAKLTDILNLIRQILNEVKTEIQEKYTTQFEHEVLVKELFDFNGLPYPTDSETTFDVLSRLEFIIPCRDGIQIEYSVAQELPEPEKVLRFPEGWSQRLEEFVKTGSILFSYLELDEILAE